MYAVDLRSVTKTYGRRVVLDNLDLSLDPAAVCGVIGPNGAGKTTLLRLMAGLVAPDRGRVAVCGRPLSRLDRGSLAYFAGESSLPPSVGARAWCRSFGADGLQCRDRRSLGILSRGSRQLAGLRAALAPSHPRVLLLDEPWEGLDPDGSRWLNGRIVEKKQRGVAVIVSSHRLHDLAGVCDSYAFLVDGRLTAVPARALTAGQPVTGTDLTAAFDHLKGEARFRA